MNAADYVPDFRSGCPLSSQANRASLQYKFLYQHRACMSRKTHQSLRVTTPLERQTMNLLLNTPLPLGTFTTEASWRSDDELVLCEEAASACNVGGTLTLVDDTDDQLEFYCTLTSTATPERIAFRYSLPARTGTVVIDRLHTRSEALAEFAFTAAGGDDDAHGKLIRLVGAAFAARLTRDFASDLW